MAQIKEKKDIRGDTVKEIFRKTGQKGGYYMRVVKWTVEGKEYPPSFEKREFILSDNGERMGKAKGLSQSDVINFVENIRSVCDAMEIDFRLVEEAWQKGSGEQAVAGDAQEPAEEFI